MTDVSPPRVDDAAPRAASAERADGKPRSSTRPPFTRYRDILFMLVLRDLQARSKQAYLGYFWILVQPLLLTGAFTFLVTQVLGRSSPTDIPYPVFLMAALIPWQYFASSLTESAESLVKNVDLVRQVYFPREILAIYPMFSRLVDVVVGCAALAVFMIIFQVPPGEWAFLAPVIVLIEMLFVAALGLLLSAANVAWRDVARGLPLMMFLLLYTVPVLYTADQVPQAMRPFFVLNPMAHLIEAFRAAVLGTHEPDLLALGILAVMGVLALLLAQRIFSVFDGVLADVI